MKSTLATKTLGLRSVDELPARYAAICGSLAGGIAAALTTPLDVAKTRIMLGSGDYSSNFVKTMVRIAKEEGGKTLFRGVVPRVTWISIGGAIFLGVYERVKKVLVQKDMLS
jgi:solute carrier family 25 S-adenosylmethionine transporter 26